jgi:hypothetical protein
MSEAIQVLSGLSAVTVEDRPVGGLHGLAGTPSFILPRYRGLGALGTFSPIEFVKQHKIAVGVGAAALVGGFILWKKGKLPFFHKSPAQIAAGGQLLQRQMAGLAGLGSRPRRRRRR